MTLAKPIPSVTADSKAFRAGCAEGTLLFQRCERCATAQFPPAPVCRRCGHDSLRWYPTTGQGTIHAVTTVYRGPSEAFRDDCPYVLALVDIDEGFRIMLNVVGFGASEVRIGDAITVIFEQRSADIWIPQAELMR
jgi:uncharacterized protein